MTDEQVMVILLSWALIGALVGTAVGQRKGRAGAGALFGLLLGPIGWLVVAVGPDLRAKCPDCGGTVPRGVRKCMHCGSELPVEFQADNSQPAAVRSLRCAKCSQECPSIYYFYREAKTSHLLCSDCASAMGPDEASAFVRGGGE